MINLAVSLYLLDLVFCFCICLVHNQVTDHSSLPQTSVTETSAPELANLLFWLMVVGYSSHNIEVFFDMERIFGAPPGKNV